MRAFNLLFNKGFQEISKKAIEQDNLISILRPIFRTIAQLVRALP